MGDKVLALCASGKTGQYVCRALSEAGFDELVFGLIDYFGAAKWRPDLCSELGTTIIEALARAGVDHLVWCSVGWARSAPDNVTPFHALEAVAESVRAATLSSCSIMSPPRTLKTWTTQPIGIR